jgi:PRD1 phage membrane DNA delivery
MGDQVIQGVVTIASAIVGIAIIAVLVSKQANTGSVISSAASGFAQDIGAAVSPITGGSSFAGGGGGLSSIG